MFIVQVLGIVQLSMFVRGRIFLFIFGGEERGAEGSGRESVIRKGLATGVGTVG